MAIDLVLVSLHYFCLPARVLFAMDQKMLCLGIQGPGIRYRAEHQRDSSTGLAFSFLTRETRGTNRGLDAFPLALHQALVQPDL